MTTTGGLGQEAWLPADRQTGETGDGRFSRTPPLNWSGEAVPPETRTRPSIAGKFFTRGGRKLYLKGVCYGPFGPPGEGEYGPLPKLLSDFRRIREHGMNCIRVYTVPHPRILDVALDEGLFVLLGLPWEQHVTFLDSRQTVRGIEDAVRSGVAAVAGHPALLGCVVGNEIPASVVRWYGSSRIEGFLSRLFRIARAEDPDGLFTYVNYPTTEYLHLSGPDFVCFNVFLETPGQLSSYLYHLQSRYDGIPLVVSELGLDTHRHGEVSQAESLRWQIRSVFQAGCAGSFVFSWTDEWFRGGTPVEDWAFGLTDWERRARPALDRVSETFESIPFGLEVEWPEVSVVVCVRDGEQTIGRCLEALGELAYPDYEVVVVDDGSRDRTSEIVSQFSTRPRFRLLKLEGGGLSAARNAGWKVSTGEIVAYVDADAYPDQHWLQYLVDGLRQDDNVAVGGPGLAPAGVGITARCVASAPGWPRAVLLSDRQAEHIPGCNMAFWKKALVEVGGFDPRFDRAGDDVDICWRLRSRGWSIGYNPGAVVWHFPRPTILGYWAQQRGYGRAERLLEQKWPSNHDALGQVTWRGTIYDGRMPRTPRIYYGVWGSSLFQAIYHTSDTSPRGLFAWLSVLLSSPEGYLLAALLVGFGLLGILWPPLLLAWFVVGTAVVVWSREAIQTARGASRNLDGGFTRRARQQLTIGLLVLSQPCARLLGRVGRGLVLLRGCSRWGIALPRSRVHSFWHERWLDPVEILQGIEAALREQGAVVARGGLFDRWDLEIRSGTTGYLRIQLVHEDHAQGRQLVRFSAMPRPSRPVKWLLSVSAGLGLMALLDGVWPVSLALGAFLFVLGTRAAVESGIVVSLWLKIMESYSAGRKLP